MLKYRFVKRINTKITMIRMIFASIINERKGEIKSRYSRIEKEKWRKRKEKRLIMLQSNVTLERTHVADEGSAMITARQIGTQWIRYRYARTDSVRFFLTTMLLTCLLDHLSRLPRISDAVQSLRFRGIVIASQSQGLSLRNSSDTLSSASRWG